MLRYKHLDDTIAVHATSNRESSTIVKHHKPPSNDFEALSSSPEQLQRLPNGILQQWLDDEIYAEQSYPNCIKYDDLQIHPESFDNC